MKIAIKYKAIGKIKFKKPAGTDHKPKAAEYEIQIKCKYNTLEAARNWKDA